MAKEKIILTYADKTQLNQIRDIDLVAKALKDVGTVKNKPLVYLEVWRIVSLICYGKEPGRLTEAQADELEELLDEHYAIYTIRDIDSCITRIRRGVTLKHLMFDVM